MATTADPIQRLTTSDRVVAEVRRRIWTGEFRSGSRLNQDDLAAAMGVSRIPIREALITLAHEGAVRMSPHRGAFVETLSEAAVRDHYELYGHIDGFALRKMMERAAPDELAALVTSMRETATLASSQELFTHITSVRARVHGLGGSPRFAAVSRGLVGIVPGNFFVEVPGAGEIAAAGLPLVADAVEAGDADAAATAYSEMIVRQGELAIAQLIDRGVILHTSPGNLNTISRESE